MKHASSISLKPSLEGIDEIVDQILSGEHDLEHRNSPHWNCPRCEEEGRIAPRVRMTRTSRRARMQPNIRTVKNIRLHWVDRVKEAGGEWVVVDRRRSGMAAYSAAAGIRKQYHLPQIEVKGHSSGEIRARWCGNE